MALQTEVGSAEELGSAPTLSRLETSASSEHAVALNEVLIDQFIASRKAVPAQLVLDANATHVLLYGAQEGAHFHAHYDSSRASVPCREEPVPAQEGPLQGPGKRAQASGG